MTTTDEPTPQQLRDAWVSLMSGLELTLVTTREHARASAGLAKTIRDDTGHQPTHSPAEWHASRWAATRLLEALKALPVPEVPVDHALGQLTLVDSSTPGEKSVDGEE